RVRHVELTEQVFLLDIRQDHHVPAQAGPGVVSVRQFSQGVVVVVTGQPDLLQLVGAAHAGGGLSDLLNGGEQQPDEGGDDRDDDEQLDEGEPLAVATGGRGHSNPPGEG